MDLTCGLAHFIAQCDDAVAQALMVSFAMIVSNVSVTPSLSPRPRRSESTLRKNALNQQPTSRGA